MKELSSIQQKLFDKLHNERKNDYKVFSKPDYAGVWKGIIDKYPDSAHFIYELLQNADDAEATNVYIQLSKEKLLFKHNGKKHFDVTDCYDQSIKQGDINAITGIGNSTKSDNYNKIGKFGVGFKAVFQYTDNPEIYDDVFKFKIKNYIIPELIKYDHPFREDGETLFVIPFKNQNCYDEIKTKLHNMTHPILFLNHLDNITINILDDIDHEELEYSKSIIEEQKFEDNKIIFRSYELKEADYNYNILLFSQLVDITTDKENDDKHNICIGFYYDSTENKLITNKEPGIFCFFPTKENVRTCFISHAPFLLTDNRQNFKPSEKINKLLFEKLADLTAKSIIFLRDYSINNDKIRLVNENITEIIPDKIISQYYDEEKYSYYLKKYFNNLIDKNRIYLSRNGDYLSIKDICLFDSPELESLIDKNQLRVLIKKDNVDFCVTALNQAIKNNKFLREKCISFDALKFAYNITVEFMNKQNIDWVKRMYKYFSEKGRSTYNKDNTPLRNAPIIKTNNESWIAPYNKGIIDVFLPIDGFFSEEFKFVSNEFNDEQDVEFFKNLGLKQPDVDDYINCIILKRDKDYFNENNFEQIRNDFNTILHRSLEYKDNSERDKFFSNIKQEKYLLLCKDKLFHECTHLYFYSDVLYKYFLKDDSKFIDIDFYESNINYDNERLNEFFERIGVNKYPKIIDYYCDNDDYKSNFDKAINELKSTTIKFEGFNTHQNIIWLDGFESVIKNSLDNELSFYIWNDVLTHIELEVYDKFDFNYLNIRHNEKFISLQTAFKKDLINNKWILNNKEDFVFAHEIYIDDLHPRYNRDKKILEFLDIKEKPKCSSLLELGASQEQEDRYKLGCDVSELAKEKGWSEEDISQWIKDNLPNKDNSNNGIIGESNISCTSSQVINNLNYVHHTRNELSKNTITDMFVDPISENFECNNKIISSSTNNEEVLNKLIQKEEELNEKKNRIEELRDNLSSLKKYSKEWFITLLELEYYNYSTDDDTVSLKINFSSVSKEPNSDRIYVFNNPSRYIPIWIEECNEIPVECTFYDSEEIRINFEVANVRDYSLRLKANCNDNEILKKIDWNNCTRASITINNKINLLGNIFYSFKGLQLPDGFNLKDNLQNNLEFVFGPPGTGKTTTLARKIISLMEDSRSYRILVLAPTNTACDEIARKILELSKNTCPWLYRFIATADCNLDNLVIDRQSNAYDEENCCIISTIARLSFDGFNNEYGVTKLSDITWNMVICDEASMIPIAEITYAIYTFKNIPILIAGDPMQIKPIVHENEWKDENIYTMVNLDKFDNPQTEPIKFTINNLDTQYRSVPEIGNLFSQYAYDGKLKHNRSSLSNRIFGNLKLSPINFISFKVDKYDSMFGVKKLDNSNVHIYSAVLTVEMLKYIINNVDVDEVISVGIVCPYAPQAQIIDSLIGQMINIPSNISVTIGTVHRFQGGQCTIMLVVLNPPKGIKMARSKIFLNDKNIINVAISRAQNNLCILLPHKETDDYIYLDEINKLGKIASDMKNSVLLYTCDEIEDIIFGRKFYIESNSFVTSHQLTNVYSKASKKYEVRIDEQSIDIQIGDN